MEMSDRNADEGCEVCDAHLCANARFDELGDAPHLPRRELRGRNDVIRSHCAKAAREIVRQRETQCLGVNRIQRAVCIQQPPEFADGARKKAVLDIGKGCNLDPAPAVRIGRTRSVEEFGAKRDRGPFGSNTEQRSRRSQFPGTNDTAPGRSGPS
jgi:hypothetical protein